MAARRALATLSAMPSDVRHPTSSAAWTRLAMAADALARDASSLVALLAKAGPDAPAPTEQRLVASARAADAATVVIELLAPLPDLAQHARAALRFRSALLSWHGAVLESSPYELRFQAALMQHAAPLLTSALHLATLAHEERSRQQE